jgi:hypothetical protein
MTDPELTGVRSSPASRIDGCGSAELSRVKFLEDQLPAEGVKIISLPTSIVVPSHTWKTIVEESQVIGGFVHKDGTERSDLAATQRLSTPVACVTDKMSQKPQVPANIRFNHGDG